MKFASIFLVILLIDNLESVKKNKYRDVYKNISDFLAQRNHEVSIIISDSLKDQSEVILSQTFDIPHKVTRFQRNSQNFILNSSTIVFLNSIASLEDFNTRAQLPKTFSLDQQIFIHLKNLTFNENERLREANVAFRTITKYEYLIVEEEDVFKLLTFTAFTAKFCHRKQAIEVNKFDKKTRKWQHETFWIDKFADLYGCPLKILVYGGLPEFSAVKLDYANENIVECNGYICAILKDISSALNFKYRTNMFNEVNFTFPAEFIDLPIRYRSLNVAHSLKNACDIAHPIYTRPLYNKEHFIAIPPGFEYNGYEKMLTPFDGPTWMWIGVTFASAFVTIFALRFVDPSVKKFVIGRDTKNPALHVVQAFFGISQIICPGRNFARYLLMMFILFSLIIRTAYQGVMFTLLQKEMRKPTVTTIDEMIDEKFTFFMQLGFKNAYQELDLVKRGHIVDEWTSDELYAAYDRLFTPGTKTGVFYHKDMYDIAIRSQLNRTTPPKLILERYMLEQRALMFPPLHIFYQALDKKIQQLIEGGLIEYHLNKYYDQLNPARFATQKESCKVLTLAELEAGFVICLAPLVLSLFVFFVERTISR